MTHDGPGFASRSALTDLWQQMLERQSTRGRRFAIGVDGIRLEVFERDLERRAAPRSDAARFFTCSDTWQVESAAGR
ncbi:MAG: hypothetical protein ACKO2K_18290, partial [Alphaproteobacteria bacterium]